MVPSSLGCGSTVLAAMAIFAPSAAALSAIARPIPREPPVMNRVLPFNDIGVNVSSRSFGKCRMRTGNAVCAFGHTAFETGCLNRQVFGEKACEPRAAGAVPGAQGCECFLSEHAAARSSAEQPQIGCGAG